MEESMFVIEPNQFSVHRGDVDLLGRGAFGYVHRCYHEKYGTVAIKVFDPQGSRDHIENIWKLVNNEMKIMQACKSPHVTDVYGVTRISYFTFGLVMEYLPQGCLYDLVDKVKRQKVSCSWSLFLRIMHETAAGMAHLHKGIFDKRITHNDLKPENILLDADFHAKLCDFGGSNIAPHTSCRRSSSSILSSNTYTVNYAAPEYLIDETIDRTKSMDVYSFGMTVYFVLKKSHPFCRMESREIVRNAGSRPKPTINTGAIVEKTQDEQDKEIIWLLSSKMKECWEGEPANRPKIEKVKKDLEEKLDSTIKKGIEITVEELRRALPAKQESTTNRRVKLDEKRFAGGDTIAENRPQDPQVALAVEIDISHTETDLQENDKVILKTRAGLAECVVERVSKYSNIER